MILTILTVKTPVIFFMKSGWIGVILTLRMDIMGFSRMMGRPQLPVSNCASMTTVEEMAMLVRLRQDSWGATVSAADYDPGPVMDFLGPPCCRGPTEMEDSRNPDLQECLWDSSGPSCDLGVTCGMELGIWPPDTVVAISEKGVRSGMMCLLNFKLSVEFCMIAHCMQAAFAGNGLFVGDSLGPGVEVGGGGGRNASPDDVW